MGWDFSTAWQTKKDVIQYVLRDNDFESNGQPVKTRTCRHCVRGRVMWAIREQTRTTGVEKYIMCYLLAHDKAMGWGYKDFDETAGPNEVSCPLSYFDEVPDPGSLATDWRRRCREAQNRPKMVDGMRIKFDDAIRFTDGVTESEFTVILSGRKTRFRRQSDSRIVRISRHGLAAATVVSC